MVMYEGDSTPAGYAYGMGKARPRTERSLLGAKRRPFELSEIPYR